VLKERAKTDVELRQAVAASAIGGPAAPQPFDALARQIGDAACHVTDAQVADALSAAGSQKAAFELVLAAAVGAGLLRWDRAVRALKEARDAPA
jgi:hypothetical protein